MSKATLLVAAFSASISVASAQGIVPLAQKRFTWGNIPYRVDTDKGQPRGEQKGYNICNSTTEGPTSLCQTAIFNSLDNFCFWAPAEPGHTVGDIEGEMIAWCTQPGNGARVIPDGTLSGVQFTKAPDYIQVVGFMNQTKINMIHGDAGGEMDPHGADRRGNPMGGLIYSNAWTGSYLQGVQWHNFMGNDHFCLKVCDPAKANGARMCEHIYDTQGCAFNAPSNARDGVFESCASDNQPLPGQGAPIAPRSSLCSTFASTAIYGASATETVPIPGASTMTFSSIPGRPTPSTTVASSAGGPGGSGVSGSASRTSGGIVAPSDGAAVGLGAGVSGGSLLAVIGAVVGAVVFA